MASSPGAFRSGFETGAAEGGHTAPARDSDYVALEDFTWHPEHSYHQFIDERLSEHLGGERCSDVISVHDHCPNPQQRLAVPPRIASRSWGASPHVDPENSFKSSITVSSPESDGKPLLHTMRFAPIELITCFR